MEMIKAFFLAGFHGAPMWVWFSIAALLALDFTLPKLKFKPNSTIELIPAAVKFVAWALARITMAFPPTAFIVALIKSFFGGDPPAGGGALKTVLVLLVFGAFGCPATTGSTVTYQSGTATARIGSASIDGFEQFDHDYQQKIVADGKKAGKTSDEIMADLKSYRTKRPAVNKAFADFGATLLTGRALIPLVLSGVKKQTDLDAWSAQVVASWADVEKAIALLKGGAK